MLKESTMNNLPKVTIITCVWNLLKEDRIETFRQTMESVHGQTYADIEHIIINNNSTDGTDRLIDEYVSKGWAVCHFHPVQGLWHAMNRGIEVATGEYINFMNSDDCFVHEDTVSIAVKALTENNAEWFYADANRLFEDGRVGRWHIPDVINIAFGQCPCHQTLFMSTKTIREFGGFDLTFPLCCDDRMFLRLLAEGRRYVFWPKPIANFRQGGFSSKQTGYQNEYAQNFYNQFGKTWGMTFEECKAIYLLNSFSNNSISNNFKLAKKIKNKEWRCFFKKKYKEYLASLKQTTFSLFGVIPIFKLRREPHSGCIYLFGFIPVLRKQKGGNTL